METAARMQNDAELMSYMRRHRVRIAARRRLRGYAPPLDAMLAPYAFSDVQEPAIVALLIPARQPAARCAVCCVRHRMVLLCLAGSAAAAMVCLLWPTF